MNAMWILDHLDHGHGVWGLGTDIEKLVFYF